MAEARRLADEALERMDQLERQLDEDDEANTDPWVRALGLEAPPWKAPGED